jgi:hypothetical protein
MDDKEVTAQEMANALYYVMGGNKFSLGQRVLIAERLFEIIGTLYRKAEK